MGEVDDDMRGTFFGLRLGFSFFLRFFPIYVGAGIGFRIEYISTKGLYVRV
jgi:hypothetical protein